MLLRRAAASLLLLAGAAAAEPLPSPRILERYKQMLAASPGEGTALDRLWKAYADAGQTAQLLAEYQAGGTFASQLILGHLLRKAAQDIAAAEAFTRAAQLDPASPLPLLALARLHLEKGRAQDAAAAFEKATAALPPSDPRLPETLVALGSAWLAARDLDRAVAAWERTSALAPRDLELRRRLAETYARHRLPQRAAAHLEYLVANAPPAERVPALQQLARIHQSAGRIDEAARALEQAIALTTHSHWLRAELQAQLIRLHERFQRTAELEERWRQQAEENPRDLGAILQLIELYERLGHLDAQRIWLEKLTALAPKNTAYRARLARLLVELDQPEPAAALYDQLLATQPANAELVFARARLDLRRDASAAARDRIEKLLQHAPGDESLRAKALEFYEEHRLWEMVERHLAADAASGSDEALTALANFYFTQRRDADAERILRGLVRPAEPAEKRAAAHLRIAQILRAQSLLPATIAALEEAANLTPPDAPPMREIQLQLGELRATLGQHAAARTALELATALSRTPAEIEDADQRLFNALLQQTPASASAPPPSFLAGRLNAALPVASRENAPLVPALSQILDHLKRTATDTPNEAAWLRLARWQLWCRQLPAARASAGQALALNAESIPAHEFLLKLTSSDPNVPAAAYHLGRLAALDPARRLDFQRRAAQLDLQAGRVNQALRALDDLAHANPGSLEILTDLAAAQQRAERWEDALTTWRQVHTLSPATRRQEPLTQMLRVFEHLGQPLPAAEMLLAEIDARGDAKDQADYFQDLLAHCTKHNLLPWLRERWQQRREHGEEDLFTELSHGRILKAAGEKAAAFDVLKNTALASPNPAETLPELIREAEELRRLDAAIELQARLVRMLPQARPDALEKLAALQEKNFAPEDAAKTWDKIVARFPRDATALLHAVEFHLRAGESARAAALLRKVRTLEPANARALFTLARLDLETGESAEAEACLEALLALPAAASASETIRFPGLKPEDAGRLQNRYLNAVRQRRGGRVNAAAMRALRSFWVETPADESDRDLRLQAARELARLIRDRDDPATLQRWIARWQAAAKDRPGEALWALFYADAGEATLDVIAALMQREPANVQFQQAFIWLALQTRQFARLSIWMRDPRRTVSERDFVLIALGQHLESDGERIEPALLAELFPPGTRLRLWQAATLYVQHGRFAEAVTLGRRAMTAATGAQRSVMGVELARWHHCLGQPAEARALLSDIARRPAESLDSPVYAALRDAWLLHAPEERPAFAQTIERALQPDAFPVHAVITRALLRSLAGEDPAELRRLVEMRVLGPYITDDAADPAIRHWNFLLTAGLRLQTWKLEAAALALWEEALTDPALARLQGERAHEIAREVRTRCFALRAARCPAAELGTVLAEYRRAAPAEAWISLGEALESLGAHARAIAVYHRLWEREPGNPQALRNLLSVCRTAGDHATAETVLRTCVAQRLFHFNESLHRELLTQWIDLLEQRHADDEALALLRGAVEIAPHDARLMVRLAQHHERAGRVAEAEAMWRRVIAIEPQHTTARLALSSLLEKQNQLPAALHALTGGGSAETESRRAQLLFQSGKNDDALHALEQIIAPGYLPAAQSLARTMAQAGETKLARSVLQSAAGKNTEPLLAMQLQSQLLETLTPATDRALIPRELRKLRRLAGDDPGRLGVYFSFLQIHARMLGMEEEAAREMREAWDDGAGSLPAGMVLLAWQLDRGGPAAEPLLDRLLQRDDAREPWLRALLQTITAAARPDLAPRIHERLTRVTPLSDAPLGWARALAAAGQREAAVRTLHAWSARATLDDEVAAKTAAAFVELGEAPAAERLLADVLGPIGVRSNNHHAHLELARLRVARGDFRGAKKPLAAAFQHPALRDYSAIVTWLEASGRLDQMERELIAFDLPPERLEQVRRAVAEHRGKSARRP